MRGQERTPQLSAKWTQRVHPRRHRCEPWVGGAQGTAQPKRRPPVDAQDPVLDQVERIVLAADAVGGPVEAAQVPEQAAT